MSLWRHGEGHGNEIESPEQKKKNPERISQPVCEDDKKKLNPNQEFRDKYRVPDDKLNKTDNGKLTKPNESDNRPGQKGGEGRGRGIDGDDGSR